MFLNRIIFAVQVDHIIVLIIIDSWINEKDLNPLVLNHFSFLSSRVDYFLNYQHR